ncbi:hypothetical protein P8452_32643 [Trifolium repens]|nr:hypothetical protein P8452_32643 [Trifolium repens]
MPSYQYHLSLKRHNCCLFPTQSSPSIIYFLVFITGKFQVEGNRWSIMIMINLTRDVCFCLYIVLGK